MKMGRVILLSLGALAVMCITLAMAEDHTVGVPGGWDQFTDLEEWASSQTFVVGDRLIFRYDGEVHDVTEVSSKDDFSNCNVGNPLQPPHTDGNTVIALTSAGTRFFVCSKHCDRGMKVQIDTVQGTPDHGSPSDDDSSSDDGSLFDNDDD